MDKIICEKNLCTGCGACIQICPAKCINMEEDIEGFCYPKIESVSCINCNLCKKVCPTLNSVTFNPEGSYRMGWIKDEKVLLDSATGGFFSALSLAVLDMQGIVFGAFYDTGKNSLYHTKVESQQKLYMLRKSKYFQSDTKDTYRNTYHYLKQGKVVLYTGTPCQIAGLNSYLDLQRANKDNLVTAEVLCHGVSNNKVINLFIRDLQKREDKRIDHISFRTKDNGWSNGRGTVIKMFFDDKSTKLMKVNADLFFHAFNSNLILRPSCYLCKYAHSNRNSDFTMGDYWGVQGVPKNQQELGVSAYSINSEKAFKWMELIDVYFKSKEACKEKIVAHNRPYRLPSNTNTKRDQFFKYLNKVGYYNAYYMCYPKYWAKTIIKKMIGQRGISLIKRCGKINDSTEKHSN